jgi:hypothetical protein
MRLIGVAVIAVLGILAMPAVQLRSLLAPRSAYCSIEGSRCGVGQLGPGMRD